MADAVPIDEQVKAAERELSYRHRAYPRWIASGRLTAHAAAYQIRCMEAIVATLQAVAAKERLI